MFLRKLIRHQTPFKVARILSADTSKLSQISTKFASTSTEISFQNENLKAFLENLRIEFYELRTNSSSNTNYPRIHRLSNIVKSIETRGVLVKNLESLSDMDDEKDEDMKELVKEERKVYANLLKNTENELIGQLMTLTDSENCSSVIFEVTAGVGGQEAMLFARQLFEMYSSFIHSKGWEYDLLDEDKSDIGGLRHANMIIYGEDAYNFLKYEAGVHRVQRVPATEKSGRLHTSTASVAVIPRQDDVDVTINEKDLKIETKRASGAGGQHVNTTDSAVRIVHLPTGLSVESQTERSQVKNREIAIKKLQAKLYQQQVDSVEASTQATRKAQKGSSNRNEKIRTYNFVQDRITDHRVQGGTVHNLKEFLAGGEPLASMINLVAETNRLNTLLEIIASTKPISK